MQYIIKFIIILRKYDINIVIHSKNKMYINNVLFGVINICAIFYKYCI